MQKKKLPLIIVAGPTSAGKTSYSIKLARQLAKKGVTTEIISADSRQVYKGLDLLSGKVTKREMKKVPHHMIDVADPKRVFSVQQFQKMATKKIADIHKRGNTPILVGGTGFYIDAVVYGTMFPEVKPNANLRKTLAKLSTGELFTKLKNLDPVRAKEIDSNNPVRLIRAIEIATALGKVPKVKYVQRYETKWIMLDLPDEELKKNIRTRLLARMRAGMIAEAKKLHKSGVSWKRMEDLGLESRYLALYLQNKISKKETLSELETGIWHYAKRQRTWFRKYK